MHQFEMSRVCVTCRQDHFVSDDALYLVRGEGPHIAVEFRVPKAILRPRVGSVQPIQNQAVVSVNGAPVDL